MGDEVAEAFTAGWRISGAKDVRARLANRAWVNRDSMPM
jgi:hypothetical protein